MNILIFGGSFHNKGAEAMTICTIEEIQKKIKVANSFLFLKENFII